MRTIVVVAGLVTCAGGAGRVLPCNVAANVNGVGIVDLSDLSAPVTFVSGAGYALPSCS